MHGFWFKWKKWIWTCVSNARVNILINGCPSEEFSLQNGLRQDDPLSPFLSIIAAKPLGFIINKAIGQEHL